MDGEKRKVFCRIEVFEGPESILRSKYALSINTGGIVRYADGVIHGTAPIEWGDIAAVHPKGIDNFVRRFDSVGCVELEERK